MKILLTADPELPVPPQLSGGLDRIIHLFISGLKVRGNTVKMVAYYCT